ncbi:UNVERIFIED_ORG: hypothetical protein J3D59_005512 [Pseudomonas fluorescens]
MTWIFLQKEIKNVGAGLPAIAVGQPPSQSLTHRYRSDAATRQASSHIRTAVLRGYAQDT